MSKIAISLRLSSDEVEYLREKSKATNFSQADIVTFGLQALRWLEKHKALTLDKSPVLTVSDEGVTTP